MTINRTVEVRPTADELAVEFCNMFADEQAKLFSAVFRHYVANAPSRKADR